MQKVKIIPLNETGFDFNLTNEHCSTTGALCELRLDPLLDKRLRELMGEKFMSVDSDFIYLSKNKEVYYMSLYFESRIKRNGDNYDLFLNSLITALKELFETDNVSLQVKDKEYFRAEWIFTSDEDRLWLIDKLNEMGITTKETLKVEYISDLY